jgi:hypothetical protein
MNALRMGDLNYFGSIIFKTLFQRIKMFYLNCLNSSFDIVNSNSLMSN